MTQEVYKQMHMLAGINPAATLLEKILIDGDI